MFQLWFSAYNEIFWSSADVTKECSECFSAGGVVGGSAQLKRREQVEKSARRIGEISSAKLEAA